MNKSYLALLVLTALSSTAAMGADLEGSLTVGGAYSNIQGSNAKANEYLVNGSRGGVNLNLDYRKLDTFFSIYGGGLVGNNDGFQNTDLARDLSFGIKGGVSNQAKAYFDYKEINHNITNGKTFLTGIGTSELVKPGSQTAYALPSDYTNDFEYGTKRYISNGGAEMNFGSPFFFAVNVDRYQQKGLLPFAVTTGMHENPAPIDYTSTTTYLQTGYRSDKLIATVDGSISHFDNPNYQVGFFNGITATTQRVVGYESASSDDYKVGGSVNYKLSFWKTALSAKANYSMLRSNVLLSDNSSGSNAYSTPTQWNGKVNYTTVNVAATSNPVKNLTTKLYFNFLNKKNESPADFNYGTASYTTERFDYSKRNLGVEAKYVLPAKTTLGAGYDYMNIKRAIRTDAPSTDDHTMYIQAKNNRLDWVTGKLRYQRLVRISDFKDGELFAGDAQVETNVAALTSEFYKTQFRPADTADKIQDAAKLSLDFEPLHGLQLGVEYAFKYDDYNKNVTGMKNARRNEVMFDAFYGHDDSYKLNAFANFEMVQSNAMYRQMPGIGGATTNMPVYYNANVNDANNFNWTSKRNDFNYTLGGGAEAKFMKGLVASAGYQYDNVQGSNDLAAAVDQINAGASYRSGSYTMFPLTSLPRTNYIDSYIKHAVNAKLNYNLAENLDLMLGYRYEFFKYSDDQSTGNTYAILTAAPATYGQWVSGANSSPNYTISTVYSSLTWKF